MKKIIVDSKNLSNAVQWVVKGVDSKSQKDFVVLHVSNDGTAYLSYSGNYAYLRSPLPISRVVDMDAPETNIALSGQFLTRLSGILARVPSGDVTLSFDNTSDDVSVTMQGPKGSRDIQFSIPVVNSRIPALPKLVTLGTVPENEYFSYISKMRNICDPHNEGGTPAVGAIDVSVSKDDSTMTIMATDRYCLAEVSIDFTVANTFDDNFDGYHFMIPHSTSGLINGTKGYEGGVTICVESTTGKFGYIMDDGKVALFSLKNTKNMPYETIKNGVISSVKNTLTVNKGDVKKALDSISALSWIDDTSYLTIDGTSLTVHDSAHKNEISVPIETTFEGKTTLCFVREIISESFHPILSQRMQVSWGDGPSEPIMLRPANDSDDVNSSVFVLTTQKNF